MAVVTLTKENFEAEVLQAGKPVLVDFWAAWCGPCRMVSPIVDEIAEEHAEIYGRFEDGDADVFVQKTESLLTYAAVSGLYGGDVGYRFELEGGAAEIASQDADNGTCTLRGLAPGEAVLSLFVTYGGREELADVRTVLVVEGYTHFVFTENASTWGIGGVYAVGGVGYADGYYRSDGFLHEESVIISSGFSGRIGFDRALGDDFDMAVSYQYREYEGGSVYYEGGTGFGNEYLKVIGETYDGDVYTGELKEENGTPIEGNLTIHDCATALVIPERSDSSKYEAAWKFIRWAAGPEGQAILAKTGNVVPNQDSIALSDTFYSVGGEKNFYAAALMSRGSDVGDWGYFENGEWVTDWSSDFNNRLRMGIDTLSDFLANNQEMAQTACAETTIRIKGWR